MEISKVRGGLVLAVEEARTDVWVGETPPLGETADQVWRLTEEARDGVEADATVQKRKAKTLLE